MYKPKQLIILGGGTTAEEGINKGLWGKTQGKLLLSLNASSFFFFSDTAAVFVDDTFYKSELDKYKELPLCIGQWTPESFKLKLSNTILLPVSSGHYDRSLKKGVYDSYLCGLFALSLGIYLLNEGEIFILGMDFGVKNGDSLANTLQEAELDNITNKEVKLKEKFYIKKDNQIYRTKTHWCQGKEEHRGVGLTAMYYGKDERYRFDVYKEEKKCKIYTVGNSRLEQFEKINYDIFFNKLDNEIYNQDELREWIKTRLNNV